MPPPVSTAQRRARLAQRHHLAPHARADGPLTVADDIVALHATDPATVHLAVGARVAKPSIEAVEQALYDDRTLVRMLGMRRTMFVVPLDLVPVVQAGCTDAIAVQQRKLLLKHLTDGDVVPQPAQWLAEVSEATVTALAERGQATGAELAADVPGLRTQITMAVGKPYQATGNLTSRVLFLLAAQGRIVRGRPKGSWISSQYRWSTAEAWLPESGPQWSPAAARTELVRRWLLAYGPAPVADLRWWTGWTAGDVKKALAGLDVAEVEIEDAGTGLVLADDTAPLPPVAPWIALLPALDPTVMGWLERAWFFGPYAPALFDRTGNPGPTVWYDGRVVGGWAQSTAGEVRFRLLEDIGAEAGDRIAAAAAELGAWLGPVRVTPRFRTPLEKELTG
jgi:DNA glycosylase AlkZ-like